MKAKLLATVSMVALVSACGANNPKSVVDIKLQR